MAATPYSREEVAAINVIAMRAVTFPLIVQILLTVLILIPVFMILRPAPENQESDWILLAAIPLTVISTFIVAKFVLPKSLFKPRSKGQLVPVTGKKYTGRWMGICLGIQLVFILVIAGLSIAGITLPGNNGLSIGVSFASFYLANYFITQRMLKNGDAELQLKS